MMELGKTLRSAREAKGLTVGQLAEATKLPPSTIENLENEVFSEIAAPIYGRGFVKLYCEAVGLEPKPLVDEYMAIVNGTHEPHIRERPAPAADDPRPEDIRPEPDVTARDEAPSPEEPNLFSQDPDPAGENPPPLPTPPFHDGGSNFSRYATPLRADDTTPCAPPSRALWRLGILGAAAILLLALVIWAVGALYRATAQGPAAPDAPAQPETKETPPPKSVQEPAKPTAAPTKGASAAPAAAPRKPQEIPALYID